jgi:CRISPR system Cascade subunit CasE
MNVGPLYLSRARLRSRVPAAALRELLLPREGGRRAGAGHRLVWTLFADDPDRERDFLWREGDAGLFYLLSRRPPEDRHGLFDLDEPKVFAPCLAAGDRLGFSLRANATVARWDGTRGTRGKPADVVMAALASVPPGERATVRATIMEREGCRWLERQAGRGGFTISVGNQQDGDETRDLVRITSYRRLRIDHRGPAVQIGVLDFDGVLEVCDPEKFVAAVAQGFGRAKAFGCGLMLIRRV